MSLFFIQQHYSCQDLPAFDWNSEYSKLSPITLGKVATYILLYMRIHSHQTLVNIRFGITYLHHSPSTVQRPTLYNYHYNPNPNAAPTRLLVNLSTWLDDLLTSFRLAFWSTATRGVQRQPRHRKMRHGNPWPTKNKEMRWGICLFVSREKQAH